MPQKRKAPSSPNPKKPVTRKSKGTESLICVGVDKCKNAPWTDEEENQSVTNAAHR